MNAPIASPYLDTMPLAPIAQESNAELIASLVAVSYRLTLDDLKYGDKTARILEARQVAQWVLRRQLRLSFPEIGRVMNRDHSTVMHSCRAIEKRRAFEEVFAQFLDRLITAIAERIDSE